MVAGGVEEEVVALPEDALYGEFLGDLGEFVELFVEEDYLVFGDQGEVLGFGVFHHLPD